MPSKKIGSCTWYEYLTAGESAAFWHKQKDDVGVAISARDRKAVQDGKKVNIRERQPVKPRQQG